MGRQCTYNKSQAENNQEYGEERIKFHCGDVDNIASYEFNGTLCKDDRTPWNAPEAIHAYDAPKKRISLEIIFPNSRR